MGLEEKLVIFLDKILKNPAITYLGELVEFILNSKV